LSFQLPAYNPPDFQALPRVAVRTAPAPCDHAAPSGFHSTTIFPEYLCIDGVWRLLKGSRMDCAVVLQPQGPMVRELRTLRRGEPVVLGRSEDGREGIYVHADGFAGSTAGRELFSFRQNRTRESAYSQDYDRLYELLRYDRDHGYIVWVLGPAIVFDSDARSAMSQLVDHGYVHALLAGNALATHDLEGALFGTALGLDLYTKELAPNGHYHHLDAINEAIQAGSLAELVAQRDIQQGVVAACLRRGVPMVLAGSIRDDGPLPDVIADVYAAQEAMRAHARRATTVLALATQLHSIAMGNMTPSYQVVGQVVRPVYFYSVDV